MAIIYLAGGCFWGVEGYFQRIQGVERTEVGYANGKTTQPSYQDVLNGSGHVETVQVNYNPTQITLARILKHYFRIIDPTSLNQQGGDKGIQYRTGIYYTDLKDKAEIEAILQQEQQKYQKTIVTEVLPLQHFYLAEEYHQDYLLKNPTGYCHINLDLALLPLE